MDLCGQTVAVEKSATGDLVADDISAECTKAGKEPDREAAASPTRPAPCRHCKSGRADAVLALDLTLAYNVTAGRPESFEIPAEPFGLLPGRHPGAEGQPRAP